MPGSGQKVNFAALVAEEELKRLHASIDSGESFNQVAFNYDTTNGEQKTVSPVIADQPEEGGDRNDEEEKPFMAPESLAIPPRMEIVSL